MIRPPFPRVVDNTIRTDYAACGMKAYWSFFENLAGLRESIHLRAGGALAKGFEVYRKALYGQGASYDDARVAGFLALIREYGPDDTIAHDDPMDSPKSWLNTAAAFISYTNVYHPDTDYLRPFMLPSGKPAVECSGSFPLELKHPETGDPLLYHYRFDMVAQHAQLPQGLFVVDEKTNSGMGPGWAKQWDLRSQFTGYVYGAKAYDLPIIGAIVRGIAMLKTTIKHGTAITYRPQWMIDQWYEQIHRDFARMIQSWESMRFDSDFGHACTAYGGCHFLQLCTKQNPEHWIAGNYRRQRWNPATGMREEIEDARNV